MTRVAVLTAELESSRVTPSVGRVGTSEVDRRTSWSFRTARTAGGEEEKRRGWREGLWTVEDRDER